MGQYLSHMELMELSKFKLVLLMLSLSAGLVVQVCDVYAHVDEEGHLSYYFTYKVEPLDYVPERYWVLEEPDPYILEAIHNPGRWTEPFYYKDSTFWFTAIWHDPEDPSRPVPFLYNGTYYTYEVAYTGCLLTVYVLDEEPEKYWNLTDPVDKYLMEGIKNPGKTIIVGSYSNVTKILWEYGIPSSTTEPITKPVLRG